MKEKRVQCPYKNRKYTCEYGNICVNLEHSGKGSMNDCPVATRHYAGCPWRDEVPVRWDDSGRVLGISVDKTK